MTTLAEMARERAGQPPLASRPLLGLLAADMAERSLVIVGNGSSDKGPLDHLKSDPNVRIWCIHSGWVRHPEADLVWVMDDLDGPAWESVPGQDADGSRREFSREEIHAAFRECHLPIMHTREHPEFQQTVAFPLLDVMERFERPHFGESVCYAVAWAIMLKAQSIHFIGCDYARGARPAEAQALTYWIGRAEEAGIPVTIAPGSELMRLGPLDGVNRHIPGFYGYWVGDFPEHSEGSDPYELGKLGDTYHVATGAAAALRGHLALDAMLAHKDVHSVLDVGCGPGDHARHMADAGRRVIGVDDAATPGRYDPSNHGSALFVQQDYLEAEFAERFDAIWCCHMLEHVPDPQVVLQKMYTDLRAGGVLALTVPPAQHAVVGGHLTLWNAGLLLYHLVLAGFDCREAKISQYDYNISVLVRKAPADLPESFPANYPVERLREWLPAGLAWERGSFNGNIAELNWR